MDIDVFSSATVRPGISRVSTSSPSNLSSMKARFAFSQNFEAKCSECKIVSTVLIPCGHHACSHVSEARCQLCGKEVLDRTISKMHSKYIRMKTHYSTAKKTANNIVRTASNASAPDGIPTQDSSPGSHPGSLPSHTSQQAVGNVSDHPADEADLSSLPSEGSETANPHNSTQRRRPTLVLGETPANWSRRHEALSDAFTWLLTPTNVCASLPLTLKDAALRAVWNSPVKTHFQRLSPLTEDKLDGLSAFDEASTIKLASGRDVTRGGASRKRLFIDGPAKSAEKLESVQLIQVVESAEDSVDVVPGTPTKATPSVQYVLSGAKPLNPRPAPDPEQIHLQTPHLPASTVVSPLQPRLHPAQTTNADRMEIAPRIASEVHSSIQQPVSRKRGYEELAKHSPKRLRPDVGTPEADVSFVENTEETMRAKLRLPLTANNCANRISSNEGPLLCIENHPVMEVRTTSIRDKSRLDAVVEFLVMAEKSHTVRSYGATMTRRTTHLVVPALEYTSKYFMALFCGACVVNFKWIQESLKAGRVLPEDPFIIHPQAPPPPEDLFGRTVFYLWDDIPNKDAHVLKELISFCQCELAETLEEFMLKAASFDRAIVLHSQDYKVENKEKNIYELSCAWLLRTMSNRILEDPVT